MRQEQKIRCKINQCNSGITRITSIKPTNTKWMEDEANVFAVLLLIPKQEIMKDLANGFDLGDDKTMRDLCKKYDVPLNALVFRISLLNLKK